VLDRVLLDLHFMLDLRDLPAGLKRQADRERTEARDDTHEDQRLGVDDPQPLLVLLLIHPRHGASRTASSSPALGPA
jgi:hypothetical protein